MDIQSKVIFSPPVRKSQSKPEVQKTRGGAFKTSISPEKTEVNTPQQAFTVHALESIMMDLSQPHSKRQQAIEYGFNLLDQLEDLKNKLLLGEISLSDLEKIRTLLNPSRPRLEDTALEEILLEIETRVMVELAKLGK